MMSENAKKWWKLAFIVVPVVLSNIGSYAKARAESKDESKASYEALSKAFTDAKKDADEDHDHLVALETKVAMLTDLLEKANARTMLIHPGVQPLTPMKLPTDAGVRDVDGDGIPDALEPLKPFRHKPHGANAALPDSFDDVVQQYKAKK
jgi:hypothetical protein